MATYRQAVAQGFLKALLGGAPTRLLGSKHRHARRTSARDVRRLSKLAKSAR